MSLKVTSAFSFLFSVPWFNKILGLKQPFCSLASTEISEDFVTHSSQLWRKVWRLQKEDMTSYKTLQWVKNEIVNILKSPWKHVKKGTSTGSDVLENRGEHKNQRSTINLSKQISPD